jgi:hypothetical protein
MRLETKRKLGEKFWALRLQYRVASRNRRTVPVILDIVCPTCNGWGKVDGPKAPGDYTLQELTIGQIECVVDKAGRSWRFMAEETGVGSGTIYREDDMFPTSAAARTHAENAGFTPRSEYQR